MKYLNRLIISFGIVTLSVAAIVAGVSGWMWLIATATPIMGVVWFVLPLLILVAIGMAADETLWRL